LRGGLTLGKLLTQLLRHHKDANMARRRKQSPFEDLIGLAAMLPWWVSLPLALVVFLWLHSVALAPVTAPVNPADMGSHMSGMMFRGFAGIAQYLLPGALVFGAVISVLGRMRRKKLFTSVATAESTLESISWREFERLTGEAFRRQGFSVKETGQDGPDGGIDLVLYKGDDKYLVQCKQWRRKLVQVGVVRELFGVIAAEGAVGGFVVISGRFTEDAKAFARGKNLRLIEGAELNDMIRRSQADTARAGSTTTPNGAAFQSAAASSAADAPTRRCSATQHACPTCQSPMVERLAKRGSNAGNSFWGCSQYPKCRTTRNEMPA
jgi:restriction system protein